MPTSPTPSPAPEAPTLNAPGPRATALQNGFYKALDATLKKVDYNNFAACFPTPAQYAPQALHDFHHDFTTRLAEVARAEFEDVLRERDVVRGLNELDRLVADAKRRKEESEREREGAEPVAPHTLPPQHLHMAHLMPFLSTQQTRLTESTTGLEKQNVTLAEEITAQRAEIDALVAALECVVRDVEAASALVSGQEIDQCVAEIKEVEMELGG